MDEIYKRIKRHQFHEIHKIHVQKNNDYWTYLILNVGKYGNVKQFWGNYVFFKEKVIKNE